MAVPLVLTGLVKTYAASRAVDAVSLAIAPGELFFLLGPSGCGKTTLLRMIAGFCEPDSGTISLGGRDITRLPAHQRDTGMVFQSYALWPHMTVAQNVAFGLEMRRLPKREIAARVAEALAMVRMADRAGARPNELSGGQQQRVALARALVIHPRCLLLDEPLSNLDAKLRLEMRVEIRRICKTVGLTAVYVTHDQKEALSIADRLAVMRAGQVCQVGTPETVYRAPSSAFVAGFIGETNFVAATVGGRVSAGMALDSAIGPLVSACRDELSAGQRVALSIRPECLRIQGECPVSDVNRFEAALHDSVYLGEGAQHQVTPVPAPNERLRAFQLNPRILAREARKQVWVSVTPDDVVVLPADAEPS